MNKNQSAVGRPSFSSPARCRRVGSVGAFESGSPSSLWAPPAAVLYRCCTRTRRGAASVSELWLLRPTRKALPSNCLQQTSERNKRVFVWWVSHKSWMLHWDDSGQRENVRNKCTVDYLFLFFKKRYKLFWIDCWIEFFFLFYYFF